MKVYTEFEQYTQPYWEAKRGKASCSNFHRIITDKTLEFAAGAKTYAMELIGQLYDPHYGQITGFATSALRNGAQLEPESRKWYELERDCDVIEVGGCESDCGRYFCSPDALCSDGEGVLELKNPTHAVQVKYLLAGVLPAEHAAQCYGALLVTGRSYVDFMSRAYGLPPLLIRVEPNNDYTKKLADCLEKFSEIYTIMRERIEKQIDPVPASREPYISPF